jgi:predicted component of type VI protein secretion system
MMPVCLVLEKGNRPRRRIYLRKARTVVGRQEGCDVRIPSAEVSRRHCSFKISDDKVFLEDLTSVNGTYVNEAAVIGVEELRPGDRVQIGPVTFVVEFAPAPEVAAAAPKDKGGYVPPEGLEVVDLEEVPAVHEAIDLAEDDEEIPEGEIILDDDEPLLLPESDNLRGILTQLTDSDHPTKPKKP